MGLITYPPEVCPNFPAHYYIQVKGSIWICKQCLFPLWQPVAMEDIIQYAVLIRKYKVRTAYTMMLSKHKRIKRSIEELHALFLGRFGLSSSQYWGAVKASADNAVSYSPILEGRTFEEERHRNSVSGKSVVRRRGK